METLRAAICDDEILLLPQLSASIKRLFIQAGFTVETDTFSEAEELMKKVREAEFYDVYFLDIDIPGEDGIHLAENIRRAHPGALLMFISAKEEMVYETFRVQPLAFVRKSRFSDDIKRAMETLQQYLKKPEETVLSLMDDMGHPFQLNVDRTMYIEAKDQYQDIVATDGRLMVRCSIQYLEQELLPHRFLRIHRSFLVNYCYIYRIDSGKVILDNGVELMLSRLRKKEVRDLFLKYSSEK